MIEHLSSLLRSSLDGQEVVPIAQELKLVTDYLEIQRTRLGGRLRYDLDVAADAAGLVPPFALQTLVENSLKHVAGRRPEGVALRVGARRDGDFTNPASIAASAILTSRAGLPKYFCAAASTP